MTDNSELVPSMIPPPQKKNTHTHTHKTNANTRIRSLALVSQVSASRLPPPRSWRRSRGTGPGFTTPFFGRWEAMGPFWDPVPLGPLEVFNQLLGPFAASGFLGLPFLGAHGLAELFILFVIFCSVGCVSRHWGPSPPKDFLLVPPTIPKGDPLLRKPQMAFP